MSDTAQAVMMALIASSGAWSVLLYLIQRHDKNKELERDRLRNENASRIQMMETEISEMRHQIKLLSNAMISMMHHDIRSDCSRLLTDYEDGKLQCVDTDHLTDLSKRYNAYKALGGNGACEILFERVKALPMKQTNYTGR